MIRYKISRYGDNGWEQIENVGTTFNIFLVLIRKMTVKTEVIEFKQN